MNRLTGKQAQAFLQHRARSARDDEQCAVLQQAAHDADDRRSLDSAGRFHRFLVRRFSSHFALFAKGVIAAGAERSTLSLTQAKTLARSVEQRLDQEER